jgi:hypothetical protein
MSETSRGAVAVGGAPAGKSGRKSAPSPDVQRSAYSFTLLHVSLARKPIGILHCGERSGQRRAGERPRGTRSAQANPRSRSDFVVPRRNTSHRRAAVNAGGKRLQMHLLPTHRQQQRPRCGVPARHPRSRRNPQRTGQSTPRPEHRASACWRSSMAHPLMASAAVRFITRRSSRRGR